MILQYNKDEHIARMNILHYSISTYMHINAYVQLCTMWRNPFIYIHSIHIQMHTHTYVNTLLHMLVWNNVFACVCLWICTRENDSHLTYAIVYLYVLYMCSLYTCMFEWMCIIHMDLFSMHLSTAYAGSMHMQVWNSTNMCIEKIHISMYIHLNIHICIQIHTHTHANTLFHIQHTHIN